MDGAGGARQLVVFEVEGRKYALPVEQVVEVVRMVALTPVPEAPPWVAGLADLRGQLIPVIDLRPRLGLPPAAADPDLVFLVASGAERTVGLLADRVLDVADAAGAVVEPSDAGTSGQGFVQAVVRSSRGVVLTLDLDQLAGGAEASFRVSPDRLPLSSA